MVKCQICQHENPAGAEYCEDCGASLAASAPAAAADAPPATDAATAGDQQPSGEQMQSDQPSSEETSWELPQQDASPHTSPLEGEDAPMSDAAIDNVPQEHRWSPTTPQMTGAQPATGQARLEAIRYGGPTGEVYPLFGTHLVVGRFDPETGPVDVDLGQSPEAAQISRNHAEIYRESDGTWYVKDLASTNGVFVKPAGETRFGPRITTPQALSPGDEVAFGNARFLFQVG